MPFKSCAQSLNRSPRYAASSNWYRCNVVPIAPSMMTMRWRRRCSSLSLMFGQLFTALHAFRYYFVFWSGRRSPPFCGCHSPACFFSKSTTPSESQSPASFTARNAALAELINPRRFAKTRNPPVPMNGTPMTFAQSRAAESSIIARQPVTAQARFRTSDSPATKFQSLTIALKVVTSTRLTQSAFGNAKAAGSSAPPSNTSIPNSGGNNYLIAKLRQQILHPAFEKDYQR